MNDFEWMRLGDDDTNDMFKISPKRPPPGKTPLARAAHILHVHFIARAWSVQTFFQNLLVHAK